MTRPLAPTSTLELLRAAAELCGPTAQRLFAVLAEDYPASLERRPGQLLRAARATAADLDGLLAAAGVASTDDLRMLAAREIGLRLAEPDLRFTSREPQSEPRERSALRRMITTEEDNLRRTLADLQANGALEVAAAALLRARRRWVLGDLKSAGYASLLTSDLTSSMRDVFLVQPATGAAVNAISDAHADDALVVFSFRNYSRLTVDVAREFHVLGASVIALTDSYTSPVCSFASHVLAVDTRSESPHHSPTAVVAAAHVLAALAAAGAKGAARRSRRRTEVFRSLGSYGLGRPASDAAPDTLGSADGATGLPAGAAGAPGTYAPNAADSPSFPVDRRPPAQ
ncbi:MurR/RpiR family transcriptional regulator [Actinacidiphila glaucinigra]|uniref:MurR/RpiR family transcriptional regulator n=1 Tax=Actinacidiphila glaucinigra TaxID=235986 RepID=UPI0036E751AD